ncbi:S-adenosyl-L-methionine-dependent methyltransferase [Vibrio phage 1.007.O._10N.261.55.F9]|nr:S-adenosyl-L-methionine-dependent methyltransferase [Vibrio phage 1.007.O._10N.261.55.F9]
MKVLIACEESQAVCKEFRKLGHEAYSCDTQECSGGRPEWHIQDDALKVINREEWDMIIAFPPCTDLSSAGAPSWKQKQADGRQQAAIDFVYAIRDADCELIAIENPTGKLNTSWRKPDQIINPFQFGDPFKKRTCLWLKGLPKLEDTNVVEPKYHYTSNSTRGGLLKDGTRKKSSLPIYKAWDSPKERSKTFPGIAKAMAEQWGCLHDN